MPIVEERQERRIMKAAGAGGWSQLGGEPLYYSYLIDSLPESPGGGNSLAFPSGQGCQGVLISPL